MDLVPVLTLPVGDDDRGGAPPAFLDDFDEGDGGGDGADDG